jgi:hypothetical protein
MTNKSTADCKPTPGLCRYDSASRIRFFNGMLLSDEHLSAEQLYHRSALKRLNRYIWGAGIVCGFDVTVQGLCVKVHPGFAIDCEGNAIESCSVITIDLIDICRERSGDACTPPKDAFKKCLMLRYHEIGADTVAVATPGDDCGGASKPQASRIREGFCLELCDECPTATCQDMPGTFSPLIWDGLAADVVTRPGPEEPRPGAEPKASTADYQTVRRCMDGVPECPKCGCDCDDCGLCLATLTINCEKRVVTDVDGSCRQYIFTPRHLKALMSSADLRMTSRPGFGQFKAHAIQMWRQGEAPAEKPTPRSRKSD